jgi:hypothetical protein
MAFEIRLYIEQVIAHETTDLDVRNADFSESVSSQAGYTAAGKVGDERFISESLECE